MKYNALNYIKLSIVKKLKLLHQRGAVIADSFYDKGVHEMKMRFEKSFEKSSE